MEDFVERPTGHMATVPKGDERGAGHLVLCDLCNEMAIVFETPMGHGRCGFYEMRASCVDVQERGLSFVDLLTQSQHV